jgi:hypothetical protein
MDAMIKYSSKHLGQSFFDKIFPTSPGRVDPRTGMLVATGSIPVPELRTMAVDRSRGEDRGYGRGEDRGYGRGEDRGRGGEFRGESSGYPWGRNDFSEARRPGMSGSGDSTGILQNPLTWILVGAGILITLEATGVTHLSKNA